MKILHVAAEIFPLVKTGGLADVTGAILPALNQRGIDARIVLPGLPAILEGIRQQKKLVELGACFGAGQVTIRQGRMPVNGVQVYIVDAPWLYIREGNPYVGPTATAGQTMRADLPCSDGLPHIWRLANLTPSGSRPSFMRTIGIPAWRWRTWRRIRHIRSRPHSPFIILPTRATLVCPIVRNSGSVRRSWAAAA